jgi:hypothetical protein
VKKRKIGLVLAIVAVVGVAIAGVVVLTGESAEEKAGQAGNDFVDALVQGNATKACSLLSDTARFSMAQVVSGYDSPTGYRCADMVEEYTSYLGDEKLQRMADADFKGSFDDSDQREGNLYPDGDVLKRPTLRVERFGDVWKLVLVPDPDKDFEDF